MHGNVYERCADWIEEYPKGEVDPQGPQSGDCRVVRGGSFVDDAAFLRSALRGFYWPSDRDNYVGFRAARTFAGE